jgi:hypothetical protein
MREIRRKILQFLADLVIKSLEMEKNEIVFDRLLIVGMYLDDYAKGKEIYLD